MSEHPFQTFIDLIQFDQETQRLHQDHAIHEKEIEDLINKKEQLIHALEDTKQVMISLKKEVDSSEVTMKGLDRIESEKKKRLDAVSNQREYKSIQAELASINRQQQENEKKLVELWNKYETIQKQYESQKSEEEQRLEELEKLLVEKKQSMAEVSSSIENRQDQRKSKGKNIPEEWLEKYATMRMQVVNPVVSVVSNSCTACFYPVPQQDLLMLKAHTLVQCKSCYRLLYLPDLAEEAMNNGQKEDKS